jgi:hypothetical protein
MSLTPHNLHAIRHADHLIFRYNTSRQHGSDWENWLECGQDAWHSPTGYQQVHAVALEPPGITICHRPRYARSTRPGPAATPSSVSGEPPASPTSAADITTHLPPADTSRI